MSVEDHPHNGHPSASCTNENVGKIQEKINEDHLYTTDEISEATGVLEFLSAEMCFGVPVSGGVFWSSCQWILTVELNMKHVAAKFVPRLLTQDQTNTRLTLCQELKIQIECDPNHLSKIITGEESW